MTALTARRIDAGLRSVRRRIRGANYLRKWVVLGALIGVGLVSAGFAIGVPVAQGRDPWTSNRSAWRAVRFSSKANCGTL